MEGREFGIGNKLIYNGYVVEVSNLGSNGFKTTKDGLLYGSCNLSDYEHIPLTEQWLLDFGFERESKYVVGVGIHNYMAKGDLVLHINMKGEYYAVTCPFKPILKSVHQLQNLYFSLTGKNLSIN